jgi:hypothetical protein
MKQFLIQSGKPLDKSTVGHKRARPTEAIVVDAEHRSSDEPAGVNAFSVLMASKARQPPRREVFHVEFVPSIKGAVLGQWSWSWGESKLERMLHHSWTHSTKLKVPNDLHRYSRAMDDDSSGARREDSTNTEVHLGLSCIVEPRQRSIPAPRSTTLSASILKSLLQKAVRRGMGRAAVSLATELFSLDRNEAIRRLLIIIIEDSFNHPAYPLLVWLMIAMSLGYEPGEQFEALVLRVVEDVCTCPFKDGFDIGVHKHEGGSTLEQLDNPINHLSARATSCIRSLLVRASFGGMAGDVVMLRKAASTWFRRFCEDTSAWVCKMYDINGCSPPTDPLICEFLMERSAGRSALRACDYPLAGIDFHCSNVLEAVQVPAFVDYAAVQSIVTKLTCAATVAGVSKPFQELLRSAMWDFRSSVNVRHRLPSGLFPPVDTPTQLSIVQAESRHSEASTLHWMWPLWMQLVPYIDNWASRYLSSHAKL